MTLRILRVAAILVAIGGLASLWGSFQTWGMCSSEPCEGGPLPHLFPRTGLEFGIGVATAAAGAALAVLGVLVALRNTLRSFGRTAIALALFEMGAVAVHVTRTYVFPDYRVFGPEIGLLSVVIGAGLSAVGAILVIRATRLEAKADRT